VTLALEFCTVHQAAQAVAVLLVQVMGRLRVLLTKDLGAVVALTVAVRRVVVVVVLLRLALTEFLLQ
jgi:hypothetical protein